MLRPYKGINKRCSALGEGEDEKIALARGDDGEETAVGGNGKIAEGEAVKDEHGNGLADRDGLICRGGWRGAERREVEPHEVAGFSLHGAL